MAGGVAFKNVYTPGLADDDEKDKKSTEDALADAESARSEEKKNNLETIKDSKEGTLLQQYIVI